MLMITINVLVKPGELVLAGSQPSAFADCLACICFGNVSKPSHMFLPKEEEKKKVFLPAPDNVGRPPGNNLAGDARRITGSHLEKRSIRYLLRLNTWKRNLLKKG